MNLEEILFKDSGMEKFKKDFPKTYRTILEKMREACRQVLELATENVGFIETSSEELNTREYTPFVTADDGTMWCINIESILDTLNQVE